MTQIKEQTETTVPVTAQQHLSNWMGLIDPKMCDDLYTNYTISDENICFHFAYPAKKIGIICIDSRYDSELLFTMNRCTSIRWKVLVFESSKLAQNPVLPIKMINQLYETTI
tara:strand:+ start:106 stop:441 length:336 start_codon:yes stop_codon:yes gene_type:complete